MQQEYPDVQPLSERSTNTGGATLSAEEQSKLYKPNYCHISFFLTATMLAAMCQNYALACANQLTDTLNYKFGWTTEQEQTWHQTLIASSNILGLTIGAVSAGNLIHYGRRNTLLLCCLIASIGVCVALIENFWAIIVGRLIQGIASGI